MICTDHQGAAWNMAGISNTTQAVDSSGGTAGPDGPQQEQDCVGTVEQVSGQCQAKVSVSEGLIAPLIDLQMATSGGDRDRASSWLRSIEGAGWGAGPN